MLSRSRKRSRISDSNIDSLPEDVEEEDDEEEDIFITPYLLHKVSGSLVSHFYNKSLI